MTTYILTQDIFKSKSYKIKLAKDLYQVFTYDLYKNCYRGHSKLLNKESANKLMKKWDSINKLIRER